MSKIDVDTFLQQGYWANSRAHSPDPRSYVEEPGPGALVHRDSAAPRWVPKTITRPKPPPPSVEDEVESLAREHASPASSEFADDTPNRGDLEQTPILLEVHEHNPERRFVLVPASSDVDDSVTDKKQDIKRNSLRHSNSPPAQQRDNKTPPESDIGRSRDASRTRESTKKAEPPKTPPEDRRNPRDDLPPIVTDVRPEPPPHNFKRANSSTGARPELNDYHSPREGAASKLSPGAPRSATKSRERTERRYDEPSDRMSDRRSQQQEDSQSRRAPRGPRSKEESRSDSLKPALPLNPSLETRRPTNEIPYTKSKSRTRESPERTYLDSATVDRKSTNRHSRDSSYERPIDYRVERDTPTYRDYDTSEDDCRRRAQVRRREKPVIVDERVDRSEFVGPRPETRNNAEKGRYRTRDVPIRSPRHSQSQYFGSELTASRSSTFPREPRSSDDERNPIKPPLRSSTVKSSSASVGSIAIPAVVAAATAAAMSSSRETGTPTDRRNPGVLPPPKLPGSARSSTSTLSSSPPKQAYIPPRFDPVLNGTSVDQPSSRHRRLSEDVRNGELPDIAECPRTIEAAGHMDWLTLPRCDNFNICPTCYGNVFAQTEFATMFTPAPFRPRDRPIKCDFGTSQWYHIAWLLTLKYRKADMALINNIAAVGARTQACNGFEVAYRTWYSIRDPSSQRTITSFRICSHCARTIEVLLPNLTGVFVPVDGAGEPSKGVCLMHPTMDRKRFLLYFDIMETASDRALATKTAPDIRKLAAKIRELSLVPECRGSTPVTKGKWHTMKAIPTFTVCEECFEDVVEPVLERGESLSFVGNFHSDPVWLEVGACQLYSSRMRDIFGRAMRRKDFEYLATKVHERQQKEQERYTRLQSLSQQPMSAEVAKKEVARVEAEWKRWE